MNLTSEQKQSLVWLSVAFALVLLLSLLGPVLMPFLVAAILAYVLSPWVDKLSRWKIGRWTCSRSVSATLVVSAIILVVLLLTLILVPVLQKELPLLRDQIPRLITKIDVFLTPKLAEFGFQGRLDSAGLKALLTEHLADSGEVIGKAVFASLKVGSSAVLGMLGNLLLIPIVLFYLLVDWHGLVQRLSNLIPRRWVQQTVGFVREVDDILAQYLRGQILVMLALSVFYSLALALARFDLALPVGILTGLLVFIPYLGYGLGLALAIIGALLQFDSWHGLAAVAVIYGFGQMLESFYLTPRLVGERIGLHPLTVIFALMAFGQLFGFVGILVALPASAVLAVAVKHIRHAYANSAFYNQL